MIFINLAQIFIILSLGTVITLISAKIFSLPLQRSMALFIWHSFFSIVYVWYVTEFGGDTNFYYETAKNGNNSFGLSTMFVLYISDLIYQFSNLTFYAMGILFGIFGTIGLLAFDASLRHITKDTSKKIKLLATIIVFLPSVSFWSSGLGKDAISFMAVNIILWASLSLDKRKLMLIFGITFLFLIRPHIAALMIVAFSFTIIMSSNVKKLNRIIFTIVSLIIVILAVPFGIDFVGIKGDLNLENLIYFLQDRQRYNWNGFEAGIDIRSMNIFTQLFTYLFRPLPLEAHNIFAVLTSFENIIFLFLFVVGIMKKFNGKTVSAHPDINTSFFLIYGVTTLLILSMTTANFGISVRQKWMFLPFFIVLLISFITQRKKYISNTNLKDLS